MNARSLYRKILHRSQEVIWGSRSYPTLIIPPEYLATHPPPFKFPEGWDGMGWRETLEDGREMYHTLGVVSTDYIEDLDADNFVFYIEDHGYTSYEVAEGDTFLYDPDHCGFGDHQEKFLHPEMLKPFGGFCAWEHARFDVLVKPLREKLKGADCWSKTHYLSVNEKGQVTLTFAVKTHYANRIRKVAASIRGACRWACRQGHEIKVSF